jgi:phosphoribosylcarboxyaminoimidazole (NCAIR) mutase
MRLVEFNVKLESSRDITINGRRIEYLKDHDIQFDEKILAKHAHPEQVYYLLCELHKMAAKMKRTYERCKTIHGEVKPDKIIV